MGDFSAIASASRSLRDLLDRYITQDTHSQLTGVPIDLRTPRELRESSIRTAVSVWLYRVARNGDILNSPEFRLPPDKFRRRQLPIELHYLITPLALDPSDEQALLGRVLQVFHDHSILRGQDIPEEVESDLPQELRVTLETLSLEEITRVWAALGESYQLSVSYHVQLVEIDSHREPQLKAPVAARDSAVDQIVGR